MGRPLFPAEQRRGKSWAMMILQAMTGDRGLSGSLAQQEQIVMKTLSVWIATLVLGVGVAASATQASVTQATPNQASITQVGPVGGAAKDFTPIASKKTGGEQVAWCFRRWNGTWGCI